MANPAAAAKARLLALVPGGAVTATPTHGAVVAAGNKKAMTASVGKMHNNAGGEIETDFAAGDPVADAPWLWVQKTSDLHIFAAPGTAAFDAGQIIRVLHPGSGEDVTFQPQALEWTNDLDQLDQVGAVASVALTVPTGDVLTWPGAYGVGFDFEWQSDTERARKVITIQNPLSAPPQSIIDGGNPVLRAPFAIQIPAAVDVFIDDVLWNKRDTTTTGTAVRFAAGATTLFYMETGKAWDANGDSIDANLRFRRQGNTRFVEVRVPWPWLETAVYPVSIDPSVSEQVSTGNDDAEENAGTMNLGRTVLALQADANKVGVRVALSSAIASGSTIDTATVTLETFNASVDDPDWVMTCDNVADAAAMTTTSNDITDRVDTTASSTVSTTSVGSGPYTTPDHASVIQELVDDASGLASGAHILYIFDSTASGNYRAKSYENSAVTAPQADISWTESGGPAGQFMTTNRGYW